MTVEAVSEMTVGAEATRERILAINLNAFGF